MITDSFCKGLSVSTLHEDEARLKKQPKTATAVQKIQDILNRQKKSLEEFALTTKKNTYAVAVKGKNDHEYQAVDTVPQTLCKGTSFTHSDIHTSTGGCCHAS